MEHINNFFDACTVLAYVLSGYIIIRCFTDGVGFMSKDD